MSDLKKEVMKEYIHGGAKWFDRILPGWAKKIKLKQFDFFTNECILGQIGKMNAYDYAECLGISRKDLDIRLMLFDKEIEYFPYMNECWKNEIRRRIKCSSK